MEKDVKDFIKRIIIEATGVEEIYDNTSLLEGDILDSMSILYLVSEIEDKYGINIDVHEVTEENFSNILDITRMVIGKM